MVYQYIYNNTILLYFYYVAGFKLTISVKWIIYYKYNIQGGFKMKTLKFKLLTLGILSTVILSSTPVFATTNSATNSKPNSVQATAMLKNSHFKFKQSKVSYREYTYATAPSNIKTQYDNDCKSVSKTPSPSDKIYVPITSKNSSVMQSNYASSSYLFGYDGAGDMEVIDPSGNVYTATTSQLVGYNHITTGDSVVCLQVLLNDIGYTYIGIDGIFGQQTQKAVLSFQDNHNLSSDGIVGPNTWNSMLDADGF
jgi:hypothetical protein